MEDMNILAFFLSYPSLPIDASEETLEEAIKRGDEFRTYIWGEKGIDVFLKSLSYVNYGKDLKRILFYYCPLKLFDSKKIRLNLRLGGPAFWLSLFLQQN